ncbi:MAG: aminotransferase class V-fold PLP-dependent enzyme [Clostridiales bacterium]
MSVTNLFGLSLQQKIRRRFQGLEYSERLFFNNAAGALRLRDVLTLQQQLCGIPDYPSGQGSQARLLRDAVEYGKIRLAELLDAPPGAIIQDLSASRLLFSLIEAGTRLSSGNRLLVTALDHPAAIDGVKRAAALYGKDAIIVPFDPVLHSIAPADILNCLDPNTGLLVMTYTSNTTGAVLPIAEIAKQARQINPEIAIIIDGVQKIPHGPVNLSSFPADALIMAPYKIFSARGSGLAWCSPRLSRASRDCLLGQGVPSWELGSQDPLSFALMGPVGDYFLWLGRQFSSGEPPQKDREMIRQGLQRVELHERQLLRLLLDGLEGSVGQGAIAGLRNIPGVLLYFDHPDLSKRDLIVSFSLPALSCNEALNSFLGAQVFLSLRQQDSIYCGDILKDYGLDWLLRVSPMHYHDEGDIWRFLKVVADIAGRQ